MAQGMYLKANGELPCWDDVGEEKILRRLDPVALANGGEANLSSYDELLRIRQAFAAGRYPNPGLCERCAVKEAGLPVIELRPKTLEVLHVEPSYLCHLSCPQCVPQKLRKSLKDPPYHLTPAMYEGFLSALTAEGIAQIRLIIFEGRGDPLSSPHMEEIVRITKRFYPQATTCITTHGSFPAKPWVAACGLDMLRFSVDGAIQQNYARYRIGGKLDTILNFMRTVRDLKASTGSGPYVEWKYILFEWNDGDPELQEAGRLAEEVGARLRFCRTHTPGRSRTYPTARSVDAMIARLRINASQDLTFQLKEDRDYAQVGAVRLDQIRGSFVFAAEHHAAGREAEACRCLADIFALDDPDRPERPQFHDYRTFAAYLGRYIPALRTADAAAGFAGFCNLLGRRDLVVQSLRRHLAVAPDTPQRAHVQSDITMHEMMSLEEAGDYTLADAMASRILEDGGGDPMEKRDSRPAIVHPGLLAGLANIAEHRGRLAESITFYERYLTIAPEAGDADRVRLHIGEMAEELARQRDARSQQA